MTASPLQTRPSKVVDDPDHDKLTDLVLEMAAERLSLEADAVLLGQKCPLFCRNEPVTPVGPVKSMRKLPTATKREINGQIESRYWVLSQLPLCYPFLGEGKNAASLKQIRAALSFAYKHWDLKNPFAKIEPPLHKEPQIRYLLLCEIRRLLDYLKSRRQGYGSALAFHLTNALFQTACRFEELIQLTWSDCQRVGEEIVALRIKGKGSVFQDVPVPGRLSAALLEWKALQEKFKGRRIMAPGGIAFAASQFVFAGYSGAPFSNRAFNLRLRAACRALGVGEITAHGLRHSAGHDPPQPGGKGFAGNPGIAPPQEYPHHRALYPRRL